MSGTRVLCTDGKRKLCDDGKRKKSCLAPPRCCSSRNDSIVGAGSWCCYDLVATQVTSSVNATYTMKNLDTSPYGVVVFNATYVMSMVSCAFWSGYYGGGITPTVISSTITEFSWNGTALDLSKYWARQTVHIINKRWWLQLDLLGPFTTTYPDSSGEAPDTGFDISDNGSFSAVAGGDCDGVSGSFSGALGAGAASDVTNLDNKPTTVSATWSVGVSRNRCCRDLTGTCITGTPDTDGSCLIGP